MLYQSKALIELSMKIFFSKFSDHFVQSYKRSKFQVWGFGGRRPPPRPKAEDFGGEGRRPELKTHPERQSKDPPRPKAEEFGGEGRRPELRPIPEGRAKTHRGRRPRSLGARAEGPSCDPSRKAEQRFTEAEGRGVWGRGPKARSNEKAGLIFPARAEGPKQWKGRANLNCF